MEIYTPEGKTIGMILDLEDANYRPLSKCRGDFCYITSNNNLGCISSNLKNDSINLSFKKLAEILKEERDNELGIDLLKRFGLIK